MSRFKVGGQYSYIESNTILSDAEIVGLEDISKLFDDKIEKANEEIKELIKEVKRTENSCNFERINPKAQTLSIK